MNTNNTHPKFINEVLTVLNTSLNWDTFWKIFKDIPGYAENLSIAMTDVNDCSFIIIYKKDAYLLQLDGNPEHFTAKNIGRPEVIISTSQDGDSQLLRDKLETIIPEITWVLNTGEDATTPFYMEFNCEIDFIIEKAVEELLPINR